MSEHSRWSRVTRLVHEGERLPAPQATPTATPIYTSTTYTYQTAAELDEAFASGNGYVYARYGNPTITALEQALAVAEGGMGAVVFGSGMAALHAAILAAGTPRGETAPQVRGIVASRDLYGATVNLLQTFFAEQGVPVTYCDACDLAAFEQAIAATNPNVVLIEQISNPLLRVADIAGIARLSKAAGARLVVDATMTTPIVQRPLEHGADLVVHSTTKYIGGHGDATGGVVVAKASMVRDSLTRTVKLLGAVLGPYEAQQTLRGIKTLFLRVRQQCQNAAEVAAWLSEQPEVAQVHYPGLASHPQHMLASQFFTDGLYGAMVSFVLRDNTREAVFRFTDRLRLILPATSLGDVYTLVSIPSISSHRDLSAEQRTERGISDGMARLSIGIEDVRDIISDLRHALDG